jgi:hypothetical protein
MAAQRHSFISGHLCQITPDDRGWQRCKPDFIGRA